MSRRGVAPVVGVVLLVAVTVVLAAVVGAFAIGLGGSSDRAPTAAISVTADGNHLVLTHNGGDALDVNRITVRVAVDGQPLTHQPDVSRSNSRGFRYFTGAFGWSGGEWGVGETAGLFIATTTNSPQLTSSSSVTVRIYSNDNAVTTART